MKLSRFIYIGKRNNSFPWRNHFSYRILIYFESKSMTKIKKMPVAPTKYRETCKNDKDGMRNAALMKWR